MPDRRIPAVVLQATPVAEQLIYGIRVGDTLRLALTTREVGDLTGMTYREVLGAIERGELRNSGHGHVKRVAAQDLLAYLGLLPDAADQ